MKKTTEHIGSVGDGGRIQFNLNYIKNLSSLFPNVDTGSCEAYPNRHFDSIFRYHRKESASLLYLRQYLCQSYFHKLVY